MQLYFPNRKEALKRLLGQIVPGDPGQTGHLQCYEMTTEAGVSLVLI